MGIKKGPIEGLGYIYRYLQDGQVMYVGQTKDLDRRVREHVKEAKFYNLTQIDFKGCIEKYLNDVEAYYINLYNPPLNMVHPKIKDENIQNIVNRLFGWEKYKNFPEDAFKENILNTNTLTNESDYISVKDAALLKQVSTQAIYKYIKTKNIPVVYINGLQHILKTDLIQTVKYDSQVNLVNNKIIYFLLDALEEQSNGLKDKYITLIERYFGVIINE